MSSSRPDRRKGRRNGQFGSNSSIASISTQVSATESETTTSGVPLNVIECSMGLSKMQFPKEQDQEEGSKVEDNESVGEKSEEKSGDIDHTRKVQGIDGWVVEGIVVYPVESTDLPVLDHNVKPEVAADIGSSQPITPESADQQAIDGCESTSEAGSSHISASTKSYKPDDPAAGEIPLPDSSPTPGSSDSQETLLSLPPHLRAASRSRSHKGIKESTSTTSKPEIQTGANSFTSSKSSRPSTASSQRDGKSNLAAMAKEQWPEMGSDPRIITWKFHNYTTPAEVHDAAKHIRRMAALEIQNITDRTIAPDRVPFRKEERTSYGLEWVLRDTSIPGLWLPRSINENRPEFVNMNITWTVRRILYMFTYNLITATIRKDSSLYSRPQYSCVSSERYRSTTPSAAPSKRKEVRQHVVKKEQGAVPPVKKEDEVKPQPAKAEPPKPVKQEGEVSKKKTTTAVIRVVGGMEALDALAFADGASGSDYESDGEPIHDEDHHSNADEPLSPEDNHDVTVIDLSNEIQPAIDETMQGGSHENVPQDPQEPYVQTEEDNDPSESAAASPSLANATTMAPEQQRPDSAEAPIIEGCDLQFHALIKEIQKMGAAKIFNTYGYHGDWEHSLRRVPFRANDTTSRFNFKWISTNPTIELPPGFLKHRMETMNPCDDKTMLVTVYWLLCNDQLYPAPINPARMQKGTASSGRDHRDISRGRSQMRRVERSDFDSLRSVLNDVVKDETSLHDTQGNLYRERSARRNDTRTEASHSLKPHSGSSNRHEQQTIYAGTSSRSSKHANIQLTEGEFRCAISRADANGGGLLSKLASIAETKRLKVGMPLDTTDRQLVDSTSGDAKTLFQHHQSGPAKGRTVSNPIEISPQSTTGDSGVVVSPEGSSSSKGKQKAFDTPCPRVSYQHDSEELAGAGYSQDVSPNSTFPSSEEYDQYQQPCCNDCDEKDRRIRDLENLVAAFTLQHKIVSDENEELKKTINGASAGCEFCKVSEDILENLYQMMKNWRPKNQKRAQAVARSTRDRDRHDRDDTDKQHRSSRHHTEGRSRHGEGSSRQAEGSHHAEGGHHRSDSLRQSEGRHHRSDSTHYADSTRGESSRQAKSSRHVEGHGGGRTHERHPGISRQETNTRSSKRRVIEEDEYGEVENPTEAELIDRNHEVLGRTSTGQLITKNHKGEVLFDSNYWPMPQQKPQKEGGKSLELIEQERRSLLKYMKQPESKLVGAIHFGNAWDKMYYDDRIIKSGQVRRAMARSNRKPLVYERSSWDAPDNLKIPHDAEQW